MRLFEIAGPAVDQVTDAMNSWFEMFNPEEASQVILSSQLAANFKTANASKLYRCIILSDSGKLRDPKTAPTTVTYTTDMEISHRFFDSMDLPNEYLIIMKKFNPNDLLLNFSAFATSLGQTGGWDEKELWMKPTPYYTSINKAEIVYDSRTDSRD